MSSPRRILVLHAGALGDCVLAIHVVEAVRTAFGTAAVTMAARSSIVRWAARVRLIDEAVGLERVGGHALYAANPAMPSGATNFLERFDLVISFLGGADEAVTRRLVEVCRGEVLAVDPRPGESTVTTGRHITQQWASALRDAGADVADPDECAPGLARSTAEHLQVRLAEHLGVRSKHIALCHPGSGGLAKCCPIEALESLRNALAHRGWATAWMIGPDEVERWGESYAEKLAAGAPVVFEESVEPAADLACGARLFVGNDAGMTHVAALAGVPTLAIFGPTDARVWRPLGRAVRFTGFPDPSRPLDHWLSRGLKLIEQAGGRQ